MVPPLLPLAGDYSTFNFSGKKNKPKKTASLSTTYPKPQNAYGTWYHMYRPITKEVAKKIWPGYGESMPKQKSKLPLNPTEKDQLRYNAILFEEIRSQMSAVIEATESTKTTLEEKIDGVEKRLTERIEVVEMVVRSHSGQLQQIDQKLKGHDKQFEKIDQRFEKIDQRFDGLEKDVKEIKQTLDAVAEKVERHDEDIVFLKSAVTQT